MSKLVRIGIRPRSWLTAHETQELKEMQSRALAKPKPSKKTCTHPSFRRYGNAHGRFTECLRCEAKFRWMQEQEGWVEYSPKSSSSSALPMPSSANILTPKDLAPKTTGTSSKSKPKAASTPQRTYRTSSMGTRSLSTGWTARMATEAPDTAGRSLRRSCPRWGRKPFHQARMAAGTAIRTRGGTAMRIQTCL